MTKYRNIVLLILLMITPLACLASSPYGARFSIIKKSTEPKRLDGYQFMLTYDPQCFQWRQFNVYFDVGLSHFWLENKYPDHAITLLSIAPVARYLFKARGCVKPFLEISIGAALANATRLKDRNIGIHFAFQDRMGIGILFGKCDQFNLGIHSTHYSNARLCEHNSGITVPMFIDLGVRFQ